jgi:signal transduction histidine kinase
MKPKIFIFDAGRCKSTRMKKRHILLDILFVCILVILLGFSYVSYSRIEKLKRVSDLVNHTNLVKIKLNRAVIHVLDAESGQRGYLLTGDINYLKQYNASLQQAQNNVSDVIELTSDHKLQKEKALRLKAVIKSRFDALNAIVAYTKQKNHTSAGLTAMLNKGKPVRDSLRDIVSKIAKEEDKLLHQRAKEKEQIGTFTPVLVLLFSVMAILFVIFAYIKMRSETNLRMHAQINEALSRKLQQESAQLNLLLETKVSERTQELLQKNITLENMNDELLSFNYVASHDLQEPLRKIQAFSNRIMDNNEHFSPTTNDYFNRITAAASRMQKLLEALISYSRANNADQDFVSTDLNKLMLEVKSDISEMIEEKKAIITSESLPTLNVIPSQVHQLFVNLITNAIKYNKPNTSPKVNITVQKVNADDIKKNVYLHHKSYWKIAFEDNGIGFEIQYEDKIFELFQRLHGRNEFEGTGIGLAICKKIVQNHNGYIFAEGQPEIGATFFIYFPA